MFQLALEPEVVNSTETCMWPNTYGRGPAYNTLGLDTTDIDQPYGWNDGQIILDDISDHYQVRGSIVPSRAFVVRVSSAAADRSDSPGIMFGSEKPVYTPIGMSWRIPSRSCPLARSESQSRTHPSKVLTKPAELWPGLVERLQDLRDDAADDGIAILVDSLTDFLRFSLVNRVSVRPSLSIVDTGAIRAVWKNADREQIALHFKGSDVVNYVLFHLQEGAMLREFAQVNLSEVKDLIKQKQLWRLLINEG
ncbi:hypothetical protein AMK01_CH01123 [Rhizobium sp. N6212]|nr:hypothetical protein AMK01_CH01123 [Rhizobium sp. N6212]ANK96660.1 hypothetical protein AMK00_CH01125 [Rhizobium sp. N621]ANL02780.1 hypothetical protein AMJ99_CH01193 [Rhizobium esperanzae]ANL08829.1 hypothetical protein AMJ98_CH01114 [Rhizobium sp. N1341]ANL20876.1 hypothetical protein AMJ96_CH01117 [Rhizobium sp. N113]ANM33633.1 hypothetical protein AMK04_CH01195 [Rhizobium sp. N871]ANM39670.1 hypothetical protein AMK03_CH01114 [Rhizobium sp. N741]